MNTFVATDLEGTLTGAEGWKSIRHYFEAHGQAGRFRRFLMTQWPRLLWHRLGWLDTPTLRNRWMEDMAALFAGLTPEELAAIGHWIMENDLRPQRHAAVYAELLARHAEGSCLILVSALYQPLLEAVAAGLGVERVEAIGTPLEFQAGRATGRCAGPVCSGEIKAQRLRERLGGQPLAAAYGDTGPDAAMLALSAQPIAVNPDLALSRAAQAGGWRVLSTA